MKELEKDKLEKVEQLVEKAGCTYADAKDARPSQKMAATPMEPYPRQKCV